jgi:hypothetical protein
MAALFIGARDIKHFCEVSPINMIGFGTIFYHCFQCLKIPVESRIFPFVSVLL